MTGDLYYTVRFDLGKIVVFEGEDGMIRGVTFDLEERFEERPSDSITAMEFARYIGGERVSMDFDIDMGEESTFRGRVYRRVREIPYGLTATYGEIAADIGCTGGSRAVGQAMGANRYPLIIPCHRVVSVRGEIGGFSSGVGLKRYLLNLEGIVC